MLLVCSCFLGGRRTLFGTLAASGADTALQSGLPWYSEHRRLQADLFSFLFICCRAISQCYLRGKNSLFRRRFTKVLCWQKYFFLLKALSCLMLLRK